MKRQRDKSAGESAGESDANTDQKKASIVRLQDSTLQEMRDEGIIISMCNDHEGSCILMCVSVYATGRVLMFYNHSMVSIHRQMFKYASTVGIVAGCRN